MKSSIEDLVSRSIYILREVKNRFNNPAVMWSTGKDSTACLGLIKEAFFDTVPFPVIHIDTGFKFKEIYDFRDRIATEWDLNLVIGDNTSSKCNPFDKNKLYCCTTLKTVALQQLITKNKYDALIVSIRRDEHGIRAKEHYMSPRDYKMMWKPYGFDPSKTETEGIVLTQDMELTGWNLYATDFGPECQHVRVHPLLHWTELEVWEYVKDRNLPINPLYFSKDGKRYRSLGCYPCTSPIESSASTIDEIVEELKKTKTEEREGRAQDKEDAYAMQKLRVLGYF